MGWGNKAKRGHQRAAVISDPNWRPKFQRGLVDHKRLVSLDFETYYDDDYTLKKLSTSEYIRDARFETIMVGIKIGSGKTRVYKGGAAAAKAIRAIDWSTHTVLCHHAQFDGLILSHHYGVVPSRYYCSLSMARGWLSNDIGAGLDEVAKHFGHRGKADGGKALTDMKGKRVKDLSPEEYAAAVVYCEQDVDEMLSIFGDLLPEFSQPELDLIDATIQMFTCPVLKLDEARAKKALQAEIAARRALLLEVAPETVAYDTLPSDWRRDAKTAALSPAEENEDLRIFVAKKIIGSSPRFALLLEAEGIDPPLKISPTWLKKKEEERDSDKQFIYAFGATDPAFME